MTTTTAQKLYGLPQTDGCGDDSCINTIVTLRKNFNQPQVYFSGTLHGNERLGPTTTVEFIRYVCENYDSDPQINYLLDNREIIITPMTNAQGYYNGKREEYIDTRKVDINRDFGYQNEGCMESVAARVVNEIF